MTGNREREKEEGVLGRQRERREFHLFSEISFSFCFAFLQTLTLVLPPPRILLSPPPLLCLGAEIRFGEEKTRDFPTVLREQT